MDFLLSEGGTHRRGERVLVGLASPHKRDRLRTMTRGGGLQGAS